MSDPINKRNAIVCDCVDCGSLVDITPYTGFSLTTTDMDCETTCYECGKIYCEGCHDDLPELEYGDQEDPGGTDVYRVCLNCHDKIVARSKK